MSPPQDWARTLDGRGSSTTSAAFKPLTRRHWGENAVFIAASGPQSVGSGWGWVADAVFIAATGPQCLGGGAQGPARTAKRVRSPPRATHPLPRHFPLQRGKV